MGAELDINASERTAAIGRLRAKLGNKQHSTTRSAEPDVSAQRLQSAIQNLNSQFVQQPSPLIEQLPVPALPVPPPAHSQDCGLPIGVTERSHRSAGGGQKTKFLTVDLAELMSSAAPTERSAPTPSGCLATPNLGDQLPISPKLSSQKGARAQPPLPRRGERRPPPASPSAAGPGRSVSAPVKARRKVPGTMHRRLIVRRLIAAACSNSSTRSKTHKRGEASADSCCCAQVGSIQQHTEEPPCCAATISQRRSARCVACSG